MSADGFNPAPPPGAGADWTIDQGFDAYTPDEHRTWLALFDRQREVLEHRAAEPFLRGLEALDLGGDGVPDFRRLNEQLKRLTGWTVVAVPGLVPDAVFFEHLANRRFPAGRFLRSPEQLDYLREPDVFHDVFGHVPMLTDPAYAENMAAYGAGGLRIMGSGLLPKLARLYWYTVEFGLVEAAEGLRIYGAGILSSESESVFALEDPSPNRLGLDIERVMRTPYRIDDFQQVYFVIPSMQGLIEATLQDFDPIYARLPHSPDVEIAAVLPEDRVFTRGTQAYARSRLAPG
ncbi:MAG TPA: phenylalanine 4-monooxygenase [Caulobacteraceae bacterium]|jgi:phenylalanine-4-hydroxylase